MQVQFSDPVTRTIAGGLTVETREARRGDEAVAFAETIRDGSGEITAVTVRHCGFGAGDCHLNPQVSLLDVAECVERHSISGGF